MNIVPSRGHTDVMNNMLPNMIAIDEWVSSRQVSEEFSFPVGNVHCSYNKALRQRSGM